MMRSSPAPSNGCKATRRPGAAEIFRMTSAASSIEGIFRGETINTPSTLCVEDVIDSLKWAEPSAASTGLSRAPRAISAAVAPGPSARRGCGFWRRTRRHGSCTSIQLEITDPCPRAVADDCFKTVRSMTARVEAEGAGYDLAAIAPRRPASASGPARPSSAAMSRPSPGSMGLDRSATPKAT